MNNRKINILAIGYNLPIMEVVYRLINSHDNWKGELAVSKNEARLKLQAGGYDAALLCAGVSEQDEAEFKELISSLNPAIKLIRHFGGGSGLLENEVRSELDKKHYKTN